MDSGCRKSILELKVLWTDVDMIDLSVGRYLGISEVYVDGESLQDRF